MTLATLVLYIGIVSIIFTLSMGFTQKKSFSWIVSGFQNFCGLLFIFSGMVKAVDPLGTAYKMEQYFAEFERTFSETWFSFIAPLFPFMSGLSVSFSVVMIVFEIVLGLMLVIGIRNKFTAWAFFALVLFFTILTGFTFLTGYVQDGGNFFNASAWGPYKETNMRVTDCGCFGDFLKLEPRVSFFKDVFLLIPALIFIIWHKKMHSFLKPVWHAVILIASIVGLTWYCISNFLWDIPANDFRPFKIGADIATKYKEESESSANVQVLAWRLRNKSTNEVIELPYNEYMSNLASYPKDNWEVVEQIKSEPLIPKTKISDFDIHDFDGTDVTDKYLDNDKYHFMIVSHKAKFSSKPAKKLIIDSIFVNDTIIAEDGTFKVEQKFQGTTSTEKEITDFVWDPKYLSDFTGSLLTFMSKAMQEGHEVSVVSGSFTKESAADFKMKSGLNADYYGADDILLKTIVRSNPGIVLWKDGKIIYKWHKDKLPKYEEVKAKHMQ